jgi:hypothetical protein
MTNAAPKHPVVVIVRGGVADYIASADVDVTIIDFDNLEAGDCVPDLSDGHLALIGNGDLLAELEPHFPYAVCQNCQKAIKEDDIVPMPEKDIHERVGPGEPMPAGECPDCHAVASLYKGKMTETERALYAEAEEMRDRIRQLEGELALAKGAAYATS